MNLARLLLPASLILVTGYQRPAFCQYVYSAAGCSVNQWDNGRLIWGTNRDEDCTYAEWTTCSPAYDEVYEPQCTYMLRVDPVTHEVTNAELWWLSVPPGASCPWSGAPGSKWITAGGAGTFDFQTMMWHRVQYSTPPYSYGPDAPRLINGSWVIPFRFRVDQTEFYWASLGRPDDWWNSPSWFEPLPTWLGVPATDAAVLRVWLGDTADVELRMVPSIEAADFNCDGQVTAADLFCYLATYFAGTRAADWDASGIVAAPDLFAFLSDWFAQ